MKLFSKHFQLSQKAKAFFSSFPICLSISLKFSGNAIFNFFVYKYIQFAICTTHLRFYVILVMFAGLHMTYKELLLVAAKLIAFW